MNNERFFVDGKEVANSSIIIEGIDMEDWPDLVDAYVSSAYFRDGTKLTDEQLETLTNDHGGDIARDSLF